jgi:hypothetical protein
MHDFAMVNTGLLCKSPLCETTVGLFDGLLGIPVNVKSIIDLPTGGLKISKIMPQAFSLLIYQAVTAAGHP